MRLLANIVLVVSIGFLALEKVSRCDSLIVDTDIGSSPDDLVAIHYLLKSCPEKIGFFVTSGDHQGKKAEYLRRVLSSAGFGKIPVLNGYTLSDKSQGYKLAISQWLRRRDKVDFLALGGFENLWQFAKAYPQELFSFRRVIAMAASFESHQTETNIARSIDGAKFMLKKSRQGLDMIFFPKEIALQENNPVILSSLITNGNDGHRSLLSELKKAKLFHFFENEFLDIIGNTDWIKSICTIH